MADPVYGNTTPSVNRVGTYMPVTTTASISEPAPQVPRPTAVSSSLLASNTVNDTIKPALDQSLNDIAAHNDATSPYFDSGDVNNFASSYKKSQAAAKPAKTDASSTAEDTLANSPDAGNRFIYSNTDGTRTQIPVNQPIPVGYGTSMNPVLAKTPENDSFFGSNGNKYVAYSDGNYARLDENGNYVGDITSNEFNQAKAGSAQGHMESIQRDIDSIRNGSYPLNAIQQAQINGLLSQSGEAVRQQEEANANLTGGVTTAQNLYGMGNSIAGIGAIAASIKAGTTAILSLQAQTAQAVAKMQAAFQADNMKEALDAYNVYKSSKDSMQAKFDDMHKEVVAQAEKDRAFNLANQQFEQTKIKDAEQLAQSQFEFRDMKDSLGNVVGTQVIDKKSGSLVKTITNGNGGPSDPSSGTLVKVTTDPATGNANPADQEAYLNTIPAAYRDMVKGIAEYRIQPPNTRTKYGSQILAWVAGYNPALSDSSGGFDEKVWTSRNQYFKNLTNGESTLSKGLASANKTVNHLLAFSTAVSRLGNGTLSSTANKVIGDIARPLSGALSTGALQQDYATANIEKNGLTDEMAKFFHGTGATDQKSRESWANSLDLNATPATQKGMIQGALTLFTGQLVPVLDQFKATMGRNPTPSEFSQIVRPEASATLSKFKNAGYNVDIPGVYFTDPVAYQRAAPENAAKLSEVRSNHPELTPTQAAQLAQYLQENGQ